MRRRSSVRNLLIQERGGNGMDFHINEPYPKIQYSSLSKYSDSRLPDGDIWSSPIFPNAPALFLLLDGIKVSSNGAKIAKLLKWLTNHITRIGNDFPLIFAPSVRFQCSTRSVRLKPQYPRHREEPFVPNVTSGNIVRSPLCRNFCFQKSNYFSSFQPIESVCNCPWHREPVPPSAI